MYVFRCMEVTCIRFSDRNGPISVLRNIYLSSARIPENAFFEFFCNILHINLIASTEKGWQFQRAHLQRGGRGYILEVWDPEEVCSVLAPDIMFLQKIAEHAQFFSFGTNDLTQMTFGYSRDDVSKFLPAYLARGILQHDPFEVVAFLHSCFWAIVCRMFTSPAPLTFIF